MKDTLEKFGFVVKYRTQDVFGSLENKQSTQGKGTHAKLQELVAEMIHLAHRCGGLDSVEARALEAIQNCRADDARAAEELTP